MALNIKDPETERLAAEVAGLAGESKTRAVRVALQERKQRLEILQPKGKRKPLLQFLEEEIWPHIPPEQRGKAMSKAEREEILGLGPDGV
ncbi:MAG TPA: type II toxin-antitoxin system VapB family antitoxin [Chloroflexota bacterium]|nr:type II toxin-antitoxin system VapB family antitoxin [Chloroflexota bacterium]